MIDQDRVTYHDLQQYRFLRVEIKQIEDEIAGLYYPVSGVRFDHTGGISTDPSDPTAQAFRRICALREEQEGMIQRLNSQMLRIERWLKSVDDPEIRIIVRAHFLSGKTWAQTAHLLYREMKGSTCRMRLKRWMEKQDEDQKGN